MGSRRWSAVALPLVVAGLLPGQICRAEENDDPVLERLHALEQEVAILKRQLEVKEEADAARARETAVATAGKDGFSLSSPDRKFQFRLRGYAQADGRFGGHPDERSIDQFSLRRVRLDFTGNLGDRVDFRIMPDFANSTLTLFDAYANLRFSPKAMLQFGKFKPPVGLERLQSATATTFIERGFPTLFVPSRDIGAQFWGEASEGRISYQIGVFNGVRDGGTQDAETDDGKDVSARVFVRPFADGIELFRGLGLGIAGSLGDPDQATLSSYAVPGLPAFFSYLAASGGTPAAVGQGHRVRLSPQAYWYWGPLGLLSEYVRTQQDLERGADELRATHHAWQVALGWVLTGENASYQGVTPRAEFGQGGWGALELAARVDGVEFDEDVFPLFANPSASAEGALGLAFGINWYLNRHVRLSLNYEHVKYDGGAADGRDRESDDLVLTRVQLKY